MMDVIYFAMFALAPLMAALVVLGVRDTVRTLKAAAPALPDVSATTHKPLAENNFALAA